MNQPEAGQVFGRDIAVLLLQVPGYAVDERTAGIAAGRVYYQAFRFVDDENVFVFKHDVQRHLFRDDLFALHFAVGVHYDVFARFYFMVGLYGFTVDRHASGFDGLLYFIAGGALYARHQEFIQTHGCLAIIHCQTHSLEEFFGTFYGFFGVGERVGVFAGHEGV